jgi:aldose 1-epimerase
VDRRRGARAADRQAVGDLLIGVDARSMKTHADVLVLQDEALRLTLAPQLGGSIRELKWRGADVLRPAPAGASDDPFQMACFPMVPFVNRIARGCFEFNGQTVRLRPNWSADPHPLHGQGWRAPWNVAAASAAAATLSFEGGGDDWPWRYRCEQRFELASGALSVELSIQNMSSGPMPAMLGLHPYFPDAAHAQLFARLPRVWRTDGNALPVEEIATPCEWRFDPPRALRTVSLDHCLSGWDGTARLSWPDRLLTLRAAHCSHLHLYAPAGRDFFCIEPQSAAPGALARGDATTVLPGERCAIAVHFVPGAA